MTQDIGQAMLSSAWAHVGTLAPEGAEVFGTALVALVVIVVLRRIPGARTRSRGNRRAPARQSWDGFGRPANRDAEPLPAGAFVAKRLMSEWEVAALRRIRGDLPPGWWACPQASLGQMLACALSDSVAKRTTYYRVSSKSVDFAIVDADGRVRLAVELNDRTHERQDRKDRDRLVREALRQAGIPLATFHPGDAIDLRRWMRG